MPMHVGARIRRRVIAMDTILVVNAGSSSVNSRFSRWKRRRLRRRQGPDGWRSVVSRGCARRRRREICWRIGLSDRQVSRTSRPRWGSRGLAARKLSIIPFAVGHRVVHGGPEYDRPVLVDHAVVTRLERFVSLAPLHQPNNLAPISTFSRNFPNLPQVACFDTAFHRGHVRWRTTLPSRTALCRRRADATAFMGCPTNTSPSV